MYEITYTDTAVPERSAQTYDVVMVATIKSTSHGDIKVRVKVHRDSYGFQSWARAEVWSNTDLRWNEAVSDLPDTVVAHTGDPYARDREQVRRTARDYAETLIQRTQQLLDQLTA